MNKLAIILLFCQLSLPLVGLCCDICHEHRPPSASPTLTADTDNQRLFYPETSANNRSRPLSPVEEEESNDDDDTTLEKFYHQKSTNDLTNLLQQLYASQNDRYNETHLEIVTPPPQFLR